MIHRIFIPSHPSSHSNSRPTSPGSNPSAIHRPPYPPRRSASLGHPRPPPRISPYLIKNRAKTRLSLLRSFYPLPSLSTSLCPPGTWLCDRAGERCTCAIHSPCFPMWRVGRRRRGEMRMSVPWRTGSSAQADTEREGKTRFLKKGEVTRMDGITRPRLVTTGSPPLRSRRPSTAMHRPLTSLQSLARVVARVPQQQHVGGGLRTVERAGWLFSDQGIAFSRQSDPAGT